MSYNTTNERFFIREKYLRNMLFKYPVIVNVFGQVIKILVFLIRIDYNTYRFLNRSTNAHA